MSSSPVESTSKVQSYNLFFEWPSTDPHEVIVTGTFDDWSKSKLLNKTARGFVGNVQVPWDSKVKYKFIVDGKWLLLRGQPTEMDPGGYINNITFTPPKPASTAASPEELHVGAEETAVVSPPEAVVMPVDEVPIVTVPATKDESEAEGSEKPASRLPILPLNSTEHNTVGSAVPPPPDYVLPPSPRASKVIPATGAISETSAAPPPDAPPAQEDVVVSPPEAEDTTVEETPVVTVTAEAKKEEDSPEPDAPNASRISTLPILPLNSTEHNTINNAQSVVVPDFVLPPPPARVPAEAPVNDNKDESAKSLPDGSVTASKPPVEGVSAAQADKDSMGVRDGLKQAQLNAPKGEVNPSAESAPEAKSVPVKEKERPAGDKAKDEIKTQNSSSSSSSSSSSDSSKTKDGATGPLPSPPVTPGKHKRYFSFRRPGSPSPSESPNGSPVRPPLASSPSSRSATMSSKKKRTSFIGKIKEIFHHDHHDDKDSKKKHKSEDEVEKEKV